LIILDSIKRPKTFSMMFICLLLLAAVLAGSPMPVEAPVTEPITMHIVTTQNEGPGYYGAYYPIIQAIIPELAKINITLVWDTIPNEYNWYKFIWENNWNKTGSEGGWDFTTCEWWLNPTSYIWMDELVYSWNNPPRGYNIMSWNNSKTDYLWQKAQTTLDPNVHKQYMWLWQEEVMHDPPVIPMYYADQWTARGAYVDGFDEVAWMYDISHLDINETIFNSPAIPQTRKDVGSNTIIWAAVEPIWNYFPLAVDSYTEEQLETLKQGMLYGTTRDKMTFPTSGGYHVKTNIATKVPDASDWRLDTDWDGQQQWVVRIPIVQGLTWTDGVPFNATDVAFSYNTMLNPAVKGFAYGDYWFLLDHVNATDQYHVDFWYKPGMGPDYDFAGYNAHAWGISMLPWHQLKNEDMTTWSNAEWNNDPRPKSDPFHLGGNPKGLECLGPYVPITKLEPSTSSIKLRLRPEFISALGYANTLPQYFELVINNDDTSRWNGLNSLAYDLIEYPTKPKADWIGMNGTGKHKVYVFHYPAMHPLWMNLRNPILSNRYVRLAIAYAIPYPKIFNDILPGWGVETAYPGKTYILPIQDAFDTSLGNYEYNITKAQMYMNMWRYSQSGKQPYTKGPVGDHDFSGYVEIADFPLWARWF
jgi:ABC-type transport system substrate-binding protein